MGMFLLPGICLITIGMVYFIQPDITQRLLWRRRPITQRLLTPQQTDLFMQFLGTTFFLTGSIMVMFLRS